MSRVALLRGAYGALLLAAPDTYAVAVQGHPLSHPARVAAKVLGVRHLLEALVLRNGSRSPRLAAGVDALHAASMLGAAALRPADRRVALADAGMASALALLMLRGEPSLPYRGC
jgi:hypothetical protein